MFFRKRKEQISTSTGFTHVLCCLGNPGRKYEATRHNVGFMAADFLSTEYNFKVDKLKFSALFGVFQHKENKILVLKPQTYMNESGISVRAALDFYKLTPDKLVVICDDMELPCGKLRVRAKGGDGGHKGLKSIIYHIHTNEFARVRVGIGRPPHEDMEVTDWVLGKFSSDEKQLVDVAIKNSALAALEAISTSPQHAANIYNGL